jgi:hypothetical protein
VGECGESASCDGFCGLGGGGEKVAHVTVGEKVSHVTVSVVLEGEGERCHM